MRELLMLLLMLWSTQVISQSIERIEPPNWWVGMHNPELQILIYGEDIGSLVPEIVHPGVSLIKATNTENPNYLFLYLKIDKNAEAGTFKIRLDDDGGKEELIFDYKLMERESGSAERKGFDASDVMYLITPDRFANGNPGNDDIRGMKELANRNDIMGRHGGDIKGIAESLDYLKYSYYDGY